MDAIYTPPDLAEFLVAASSLDSPRSVADFAAGDGALLRAAARRWPEAQLFGSDIDEAAVSSISLLAPRCDAAHHDFLEDGEDGPLLGRSFDLILLNPPFSCRGNTRHSIELEGVKHSASKALAFVANALRFLSPGGEIIAILPASVLLSERDSELLSAMRAWGTVEQIGDVKTSAFESHAVAITVLRISKTRSFTAPKEKPQLVSLRPYVVEMVRGSLSVHNFTDTENGIQFIHTTDMRNGSLQSSGRKASPQRRRVNGPAVLISRVGRPSKDKVVLLSHCEAVLSDCVIALMTVPAGNEKALASLLDENWETVATAYGGSCAPYTTLKRIGEALLKLGIRSSIQIEEHNIGSPPMICEETVKSTDGRKKQSHG